MNARCLKRLLEQALLTSLSVPLCGSVLPSCVGSSSLEAGDAGNNSGRHAGDADIDAPSEANGDAGLSDSTALDANDPCTRPGDCTSFYLPLSCFDGAPPDASQLTTMDCVALCGTT